jgi:glycosyltransferase involved in cell wall biosynthesis
MVVRRLARALRARSRRSDTLSESGFDPAFYRETYPDLAQVPNDEQLARHYLTFGRTEGRMGSRAQADAALDALGTQLPPGFDVCDYLACNPDLSAALTPDWRAAEHYLRHGRLENRPVFALDTALYAELYFPGQALSAAQLREHYAQTGQAEGRVGSIAAFARAHGVPGCGRWIAAIRPREFAVLNWTWAGEVRSRADAVRAMLREGLGRLAPIAFGLTFDPFYFREATGALVGVDDVDLYRDWLFHGLDRDQPGSERQHLRALGLPLSRYPVGFDWRRHAGAHALPEQRWAALDHLVRIGAATGAEVPILEPGGSAFLEALAQALPPEADAASLDLLQRAGRLAALGPGARRRLAQAHMRLDRYPQALEAYRALAQTPQAEVKTFGEGARAAVRSGNPEAGLALLAAGRDRFGGHQAFRAAARATIEAAFDAEAAAARGLYTTGSRDAADAALTAAALKAQSRWSALDPVGAPIGPAAGGRVVVLANTDLRQCTHYRVEQKARLLQACGREHEIFSAADVDLFMGALPGAAAAIFYRLAATPANLRAIEYAAAMGVPTYYEIDDLIFAEPYPDPFETYGGSISRELYNGLLAGAPLFRLAMSRCEYGIASTTALARAMAPLVRTGEVFVLPNGLDDRNVGFDAAAQRRVRQDDDVLLFYGSGTKAHNSDFLDLAGPAIADILAARADVRLMVVGHLTLDARLEAHRDRITTVPFLPDARAFWSLLAEADINLAVLAPGVVADAKSEIKWLEAAVMGIPSVVSDTDRHREVLEDGVDVLLARDADGWRSALQRLIDDPALRRRLGETARAKALADYSVEANAPRLQALLGPADVRAETARTEAARLERRRRVLLVNVFFPPQTIGGATRVVRDNLDHFLDSPAASGLAFAVACTDHEAAPPTSGGSTPIGTAPCSGSARPGPRASSGRPWTPSWARASPRCSQAGSPTWSTSTRCSA